MPVIPNPSQGAALRRLGMLRTDELPTLAAQWLVDLDSPALRRLAGLDGSDSWLIDHVWPEVVRAYIDSDHPRYPPEAGHFYGLDDELDGGWGRTREEVVAEIEQTLDEWAARLSAAPGR